MKNRFILVGKKDFHALNGEKTAEFLMVLATAEHSHELIAISEKFTGIMLWVDTEAETQHAMNKLIIAETCVPIGMIKEKQNV